MKRITDPSFRYTPSFETDIRKTFAKARREIAKAAQLKTVADAGRALDTQRVVDIFKERAK